MYLPPQFCLTFLLSLSCVTNYHRYVVYVDDDSEVFSNITVYFLQPDDLI